jgi:hypothetical protein
MPWRRVLPRAPDTSSSRSTRTARRTRRRFRGSSRPSATAPTSSKGSRFAQGGASSDITRTRRWGNRFLNTLVNRLYGTSYTDLCYGYNAFWARCLSYMRVDCEGFEVETLVNVRIAKSGLVIHEVPSCEGRRIHGQSNLHAVRDGTRVLRTIVRERLSAVSRRNPTGSMGLRAGRMKIQIVTPHYSTRPGALERHVQRLAHGLARGGANVEVLTQEGERWRQPVVEADGVLVRRFLPPALWDHVRRRRATHDADVGTSTARTSDSAWPSRGQASGPWSSRRMPR